MIVYSILTISLITNAALIGHVAGQIAVNRSLSVNQSTVNKSLAVNKSLGVNQSTSSAVNKSLGVNQSTSSAVNQTNVNKLTVICPGNQSAIYLGENMWANICVVDSIPAWVLDLRTFFRNKASAKGIALQKDQWNELIKHRDIISEKLAL